MSIRLITRIIDLYQDVMENMSDPRVSDWPMLSSPFPTLFICLFYVYFSKSLGPKLMKSKQPFDLTNTLIVYNFFQLVMSIWLFYELCQGGWLNGYSFTCQPVDYSNDPKALRMANACWWYYFSKFTEFFDTVFFILRKKDNQVSNLHVIHHGVMPFSSWIGLKFAAGGQGTFMAFINTFVHIIMYLYYMISAMGPKYRKYIWWKKYLTTFQMVQFVAIVIHEVQLLFIDCDYPKFLMFFVGFHGLLFLVLFTDFYLENYIKKMASNYNTGICMPMEEEYKKSNGVTQLKCNEKDSKRCDDCYVRGTCNGYIEDIKKDA